MDAIVFDLDGTLVDSREDIASTVMFALSHIGATPRLERAAIGALVGRPLTEMFQRAVPDLSEADVSQASAAYRARFATHCREQSRLYDGIDEVLTRLQGRVPLGCATTKRPDSAQDVLDAFALRPRLQAWRGTDETMAFKPAPDVLLAIARDLGIAPQNMWYVGDTATDLVAAQRAGAHAVWVRWGYGVPEDCLAAGPDRVLHTPQDLLTEWQRP